MATTTVATQWSHQERLPLLLPQPLTLSLDGYETNNNNPTGRINLLSICSEESSEFVESSPCLLQAAACKNY